MSEQNPYSAPQASLDETPTAANGDALSGEIKSVPIGSPFRWLGRSFSIFGDNVIAWLVMSLLYLVFIFAAGAIPLLGSIIQTPLSVILVAGLLYCAWQVDRERDIRIGDLFAGFKLQFVPLMVLGLLNIAFMFVYIIALAILAMVIFMPMAVMMDMAQGDMNSFADLANTISALQISIFAIIAFVLSFAYGALVFFATPLLMLNPEVGIFGAIGLSFKGTIKNILPVIIYGILAMLIILIGLLLIGIGMIPAMALVVIMSYRAYREVYVE